MSYLLRLFELAEEGDSAALAGAYTITEPLGFVRSAGAQLQDKQKGKLNMKTLLLTLVLLITACGTNITQRAESSESPKLISLIKVQFVRNSKTPYKIEKYGIASHYGPSGPQITEDDKLATQKSVGIFLQSLSTNVEATLSEKLHQRNIQLGDEYMLRIFIDEIVVSIQGERALIKVSPHLNIKYSAILYRTSDFKTLWKASFGRPNGSTSPEDLQSTGIEIAEKVFSEFSKSGWIN